jgi:hypothetical protein
VHQRHIPSKKHLPYFLMSSGFGDSHRDTEDGICAELALVVGPIKLDEQVVHLLLRGDWDLRVNEGGADYLVDVVDGLGDAWTYQSVVLLDGDEYPPLPM